jgi:transposase
MNSPKTLDQILLEIDNFHDRRNLVTQDQKDLWKRVFVEYFGGTREQSKIAKKIGSRQSAVSRILKRFGIHVGKGSNPKTRYILPMAEIVEKYKSGYSTVQLAREYNVDTEIIRRRMQRYKVQMRGPGGATGEKNAQWKGGKSNREWSDCRKHSRRIAEYCLGRKLKRDEVIHHHDENPSNMYPSNLWIFPDPGSHLRYHQQLLKNRYAICSEGANRLAIENGAQELPIPDDLTPLSLDKDHLSPSRKKTILERHLKESGILR